MEFFELLDGYAFTQRTLIARKRDKKAEKSARNCVWKIQHTKKSRTYYLCQIYALELKINCIHVKKAR